MRRLNVANFLKMKEDEGTFYIGGRYRCVRDTTLWDTSSLSGVQVCQLRKGEEVMIISLTEEMVSGLHRALVVPPAPKLPGWLQISSKPLPLERHRLPGSWEMKGRYAVEHQVTLRAGPSLNTELVGELGRGQEVIVLDLGLDVAATRKSTANAEGREVPRLRAHVCSDNGLIGWLSPLTVEGESLLDHINLHGAENVIEARRKTQLGGKTARVTIQQSGGALPWEVGGQYRALARLELAVDNRRSPSGAPGKVIRIAPGTLLMVKEVKTVGTAGPSARVAVQGGKTPVSGWIRCIGQDGTEVLDTRNVMEYDKVIETLAKEKGEKRTHAPAASFTGDSTATPDVGRQPRYEEDYGTLDDEDEEEEEEEEEEEDNSAEDELVGSVDGSTSNPDEIVEPKVPKSAEEMLRQKAPAEVKMSQHPLTAEKQLFARKLQALDTETEEKMMDDGNTIREGPTMRCCWCNCVQIGKAAPVDTLGAPSNKLTAAGNRQW